MAVEVLAAIFAVIAIAIILRISLAARTPTALRLSLPQEIKPEGQEPPKTSIAMITVGITTTIP